MCTILFCFTVSPLSDFTLPFVVSLCPSPLHHVFPQSSYHLQVTIVCVYIFLAHLLIADLIYMSWGQGLLSNFTTLFPHFGPCWGHKHLMFLWVKKWLSEGLLKRNKHSDISPHCMSKFYNHWRSSNFMDFPRLPCLCQHQAKAGICLLHPSQRQGGEWTADSLFITWNHLVIQVSFAIWNDDIFGHWHKRQKWRSIARKSC